eukprot:gnl/TRDRNA2_/TRDRNA2_168408_c1_seq1.p1 gnl/TRDRNA2_/TRDRNA2_168408_c1~~gnl/TRDRNA2_/TRDRNA2_168408_c1_seq1.p1  ORF type:complete len:400 (+),score=56.80 gnl/TRDRNA2_/TRDRNA2_168408_c1_seq1:104-1201(+)
MDPGMDRSPHTPNGGSIVLSTGIQLMHEAFQFCTREGTSSRTPAEHEASKRHNRRGGLVMRPVPCGADRPVHVGFGDPGMRDRPVHIGFGDPLQQDRSVRCGDPLQPDRPVHIGFDGPLQAEKPVRSSDPLRLDRPVQVSVGSPQHVPDRPVHIGFFPAERSVRSAEQLQAERPAHVGYGDPLQDPIDVDCVSYDEVLQAKARMPQPQMKNTFIHYNVPSSMTSQTVQMPSVPWSSAPGVMQLRSFHTVQPEMERAHLRGECKPCAYHLYKTDGCRWGNGCEYCHLCTHGEVKKRKRDRVKALRKSKSQASEVEPPQGMHDVRSSADIAGTSSASLRPPVRIPACPGSAFDTPVNIDYRHAVLLD